MHKATAEELKQRNQQNEISSDEDDILSNNSDGLNQDLNVSYSHIDINFVNQQNSIQFDESRF